MAEVDAGAVAPEVPVTPAPGAETPVSAPDTPVTQEGVVETPVQPPKTYTEEETRKLVNERLTKERRRLERIARAEAEAAFYKRQLEERERPAQQNQPKGKPQAKDYATPEEFVEALTDWRLEQREAEREKKSKEQDEQRGDVSRRQEMYRAITKGAEEFEDFHEVVFGDAGEGPITHPMSVAIVESKAPAKLAYYLRTHPEEANRIADLPSTLQAHEVHLLAAKVTAPPKPTQAPAPIVPGNANSSAKKDWTDMSTAEHVNAWVNRKKR